MKQDITKLIAALPKSANIPAEAVPAWLSKTESIVKGINEMLEVYQSITGKQPPPNPANVINVPEKLSFSEARDIKKAEVSARRGTDIPPENTEFKELLAGILKTCRNAEAMGFGSNTLGEALMALPVTISQAREFIEKLYTTKYGA